MKKSTRILALIIAILMAVSLMSTFAFADGEQTIDPPAEPTAQDLPANSIYFHLGLKYQEGLTKGDTIQVEIPALGEGLYNVTYGTNAVDDFKELNEVGTNGDTVYFGPGEQIFTDYSYCTDAVFLNNTFKVFNYKGYYSGLNAINPVTDLASIDTSLQTQLSTYTSGADNIYCSLGPIRDADETDYSWEGVTFKNTSVYDGQAADLNVTIKNCIINAPRRNGEGGIYFSGTGNKNVLIDSCWFGGVSSGQYVNVFNGTNNVTIQNCSLTANYYANNGFMVKDAVTTNITGNVFNAGSGGQQHYIYYQATTNSAKRATGVVNIKNNTFHNVGTIGAFFDLGNAGGETDELTINVQDNVITKSWGMAMFRLKLPETVNTTTTKIHFNRNRFDACNYPFYYDIYSGGGEQMFDVSNNWFKSVNPSAGFISTANYGGIIDYRNNYFTQIPSANQQYGNGNTYKFTPFYIDEEFTKRSNKLSYQFANVAIPDLTQVDHFDIADYSEDTFDFGITSEYKNTVAVKKEGTAVAANAPVDFGVNNYEVTVKSFDGTKSEVYTATITKPIKSELKVSVTGAGYVNVGEATVATSSVFEMNAGESAVLSAVADGGEFLYWKDAATNRVLSESTTYKVTVDSKTDVVAVFTSGEDTRVVTYKNTNGAIIKSEEAAQGASIEEPAAPTAFGYNFVKWSMTPEEVAAAEGNVEVVAVYERAVVKYAVNVINGTIVKAPATSDGLYNQLAKVFIKADDAAEGMKFAYWANAETNEIISYNAEYDFYVTADVALQAVYVEEATEVAEAIVTGIVSSAKDATNNKLSFTAERSVPNAYKVVSHGIILTSTARIGASEDFFVIGGTDVLKGTARTTGNTGTYVLTKSNAGSGVKWYARSYVVTVDAEGNTNVTYSAIANAKL